jgi:hypothetical protein
MAVEIDTRSAPVVTGVRRTLFRTGLNPSIQVAEYAASPTVNVFSSLNRSAARANPS